MRLDKIPLDRLQAMLDATERLAGCDSRSAQVLREELRRRLDKQQQPEVSRAAR